MMRHLEMIKLNAAYEGKVRSEQLDEIAARYSEFLTIFEGVKSFKIDTIDEESLDPLEADILITIDFESAEAKEEYDLDFNRLAMSMEFAQAASSILVFSLED